MSKQNHAQQQQQSDPKQAKPIKKEIQVPETAVVSPHTALQGALAFPGDITPNDVRILQRAIGNQAVRRLVIQRKMTVGPVGDKYEQEADAVAKTVFHQIHSPQTSPPSAQRQEGEEEELQMKPSLQRQEDEEELQMKPQLIQRDSAAGFATGDTFESNLNRQRGNGSPLPTALRADFEPKFGANFSGVRVHTNDQAHKLNQSIQAKAFTTGKDIFFRSGAYEPASASGKELIAHELTHTIQQGAATLQKQPVKQSIQQNTAIEHGGRTDREVIRRKVLPLPEDAGPEALIQAYNNTEASNGQNAKQHLDMLTNIMENLEEDYPYWGQIVAEMNALDKLAAGSKTGIQEELAALQQEEEEWVVTQAIPQDLVNEPTKGEAVFTQEIQVEVDGGDGRKYPIKPGQDFQNTAMADYYRRNPEGLPGDVPIPVVGDGQGDEGIDKLRLTDKHHTFIWRLYHGENVTLKGKLKLGITAIDQQPYNWTDMTYQASKSNEGQEKSLEITEEMKQRYFARWAGNQQTPEVYVSATMASHPYTENTPETRKIYSDYIIEKNAQQAYPVQYEEFVKAVAADCNNRELADKYKEDLLRTPPPSNTGVIVGGTEEGSVGHYDAKTTIIHLKRATPQAMLDTLRFETGNVEESAGYREIEAGNGSEAEKGYKKAALEYTVDLKYVEALIRIHDAANLDDLVKNKLAIPKHFLHPANLTVTESKSAPPYIRMPGLDILSNQSHRQALWHWKTSQWEDSKRRHISIIENHTHLGMGPSNKAYAI